MKFKLIENYDYYTEEARLLVQEYAYDAIDELKDAPFDAYFIWFLEETHYESDPAILKQAVKDFYVEAVDSGKINQPKTMTTRALKDYLKSHKDLLNDVDELMKQCPDHLQHELKIVLSKLDESLNENKGETDKRLMVDVISNFNTVTVNGSEYVLHHINGKKEKPKDRVTSNYLLIPIKYNNLSGDEIHLGLHRIARAYKALDAEVSKLNEIPWLYVGTGHTLIDISAEEVVETLKKNLPEK